MTAMIEIDNLRKTFGETLALDGLTFTADEARVFALLGPNGSGKTTTVRILATLLMADSGRAAIGGVDVREQPVAVRRMIGLAGQHAAVDETLTGYENLLMIGRLYRLSARAARESTAEVLERLSLTDAAQRPVRTYSGGMRRRLDVGASLVGRPRVLLLDEPSAGLDPGARLELWSFLRTLLLDGTTILLTTQQLEEADRLADTVTIIDHGKVIAEGSSAELKARLGTETIEITVADPLELHTAARAVLALAVEPIESDLSAGRMTFKAHAGTKALPAAVRLLDDAQIAVEDITALRPSLDDVFMSVVGRPAQPGDPHQGGKEVIKK